MLSDGTCLMTTTGVGIRPRPGIPAEDQGCIEIYATVPRDGPRIAFALTALAECAHSASACKPFGFFDRMPFPEPVGDVAGLILAPRFNLSPLSNHAVTWCMAVPFTDDELQRMRRGAVTATELIDDIDRRDEWPAIADRWRSFAGE